jgi:hypothetical protein
MFPLNRYFKDHENSKILITRKWYNIQLLGNGTPAIDINFEKIKELPTHFLQALKSSKYATFNVICMVEAVKEGKKVIAPSFEQCLALENVEIKVPYEDFRMPFPALFVELPHQYFLSLQERFPNPSVPNSAIMYQKHEIGFLCVSLLATKDNPSITFTMNNKEVSGTIEEHLTYLETKGGTDSLNEQKMVKILQRVLINYCLLLTNYGHKVIGHINRKGRVNPKEGEMVFIGLHQNIKKIFKTREYEDKGGTHASPQSHWRSGYWRNQPYGEKSKLRKQIFIQPVFVRADRFGGDISETEVHIS